MLLLPTDLSTPVQPWRLTAGVCALLLAFAMTNTLYNAMLIQRLAPYQQARFQTPVQMLATTGRGIGPWLGTVVLYNAGEWRVGSGPRILLLMCTLSVAASIFVPVAFCSHFFASPPRLSAMQ